VTHLGGKGLASEPKLEVCLNPRKSGMLTESIGLKLSAIATSNKTVHRFFWEIPFRPELIGRNGETKNSKSAVRN
jgi:hypothetical protein